MSLPCSLLGENAQRERELSRGGRGVLTCGRHDWSALVGIGMFYKGKCSRARNKIDPVATSVVPDGRKATSTTAKNACTKLAVQSTQEKPTFHVTQT